MFGKRPSWSFEKTTEPLTMTSKDPRAPGAISTSRPVVDLIFAAKLAARGL